jgi:hypothetical protein
MKRRPKFDEDIKTEFFKSCPSCGKRINYRKKLTLYCSHKQNSKCKKCRTLQMAEKIKGRTWSWSRDESKKKCAESHKKSEVWISSMNTVEYKNRQSETKSGKNNYMFGKKHDELSLEKIRVATKNRMKDPNQRENLRNHRLGQLEKSNTYPAYNKTACEFFNILNEKLNMTGKHALNGGELRICGYSVDYYDTSKNLVIEWDEEKHYKAGNLIDKDIKRQTRIMEEINCKFYRIRQKTKSVSKIDTLPENFTNEIGDILNENYKK